MITAFTWSDTFPVLFQALVHCGQSLKVPAKIAVLPLALSGRPVTTTLRE